MEIWLLDYDQIKVLNSWIKLTEIWSKGLKYTTTHLHTKGH